MIAALWDKTRKPHGAFKLTLEQFTVLCLEHDYQELRKGLADINENGLEAAFLQDLLKNSSNMKKPENLE